MLPPSSHSISIFLTNIYSISSTPTLYTHTHTHTYITEYKTNGMAKKAMQILQLLFFMLIPLASSQGSRPGYDDWQTAHATFYGGSDATGTMGKLYKLFNSIYM